jgi:cytochrome c peroxidase
VVAGGCLVLATAAVCCDYYESAEPDPHYPARPSVSALEATTPKAKPPKHLPSTTDAAHAAAGSEATPTTPATPAAPAAAPDYLSPAYRAALECPRPRKAQTTAALAVIPQLEEDADPAGRIGTYQPAGPTNPAENAFFQPLGTNGRACVTCHEPADGMSVSVQRIQLRFKQSHGTDPIFAPVDGANCPSAVRGEETAAAPLGGRRGEGSAEARSSHSLLLTRGLIRIFLPVPANAEYTISVASDPYRCNTDPNFNSTKDPKTGAARQVISVYRRPRPSTNMKFVTTTATNTDPFTGQEVPGGGNIMWDGREPSLESQAVDATLIHAQALASPTAAQVAQIVAFQRGIFSAQVFSKDAHSLTDLGALGGPDFLATVGVAGAAAAPAPASASAPAPASAPASASAPAPASASAPESAPAPAPVSASPALALALAPADGGGAAAASPAAVSTSPFTIFDAWRALPEEADRRAERESIFRGQQIFETRTFTIANVAGLNDSPRAGEPIANGACASCHTQTAAGNSRFAGSQLDIGIGGDSVDFGGPPPSTDLPVFKVQCKADAKTAFHGATILTNDPGKALVTGKCADVGRFTVAPLRGLSARAPYFSDGSAATLADVVDFYDKRFAIGLSAQDKVDLVRFLSAL